MVEFIIVFSVMMIVVLAMSVGVIFSNKRIKGSCGGVGNIPGLKSNCSCENPCDKKLKGEAKTKTEHKVDFPV